MVLILYPIKFQLLNTLRIMELLLREQHLVETMVGFSEQLPMVNQDVSMAILRLKVLLIFNMSQVGLDLVSLNLMVLHLFHLKLRISVVVSLRNLVVLQKLLLFQRQLQTCSEFVAK